MGRDGWSYLRPVQLYPRRCCGDHLQPNAFRENEHSVPERMDTTTYYLAGGGLVDAVPWDVYGSPEIYETDAHRCVEYEEKEGVREYRDNLEDDEARSRRHATARRMCR